MAKLMPLPLTIFCFSKSRFVLPFWCWLSRAIPDKIKEGCKTVVYVSLVLAPVPVGVLETGFEFEKKLGISRESSTGVLGKGHASTLPQA